MLTRVFADFSCVFLSFSHLLTWFALILDGPNRPSEGGSPFRTDFVQSFERVYIMNLYCSGQGSKSRKFMIFGNLDLAGKPWWICYGFGVEMAMKTMVFIWFWHWNHKGVGGGIAMALVWKLQWKQWFSYGFGIEGVREHVVCCFGVNMFSLWLPCGFLVFSLCFPYVFLMFPLIFVFSENNYQVWGSMLCVALV